MKGCPGISFSWSIPSLGSFLRNNSVLETPDDKVTPGTTMTKFGGSFFNDGGEMEIDMITYKQLVSAGAQIEIL